MIGSIRPVAAEDIPEIVGWKYDPPYDAYNYEGEVQDAIEYMTKPEVGGRVMVADGEIQAFFTVGADARIPGGDYSQDATDIGLAVRPELTGAGRGLAFVQAVLDYVRDLEPDTLKRVTIASINRRARTVWERAGFEQTDDFELEEPILGSTRFVVLTSS